MTKIEGHVQFAGNGYKFYETLQPGLSCEDPVGHSSCKAQSDKRNAAMTAEESEAREAKQKEAAKEVEAAAVVAGEEAAQALKNKAGVAKHDARRIAGLKLIVAQDAAKNKACQKIADAVAASEKAQIAAHEEMQAALDKAQAERDAEEEKINATDWIAEVSPVPHDHAEDCPPPLTQDEQLRLATPNPEPTPETPNEPVAEASNG